MYTKTITKRGKTNGRIHPKILSDYSTSMIPIKYDKTKITFIQIGVSSFGFGKWPVIGKGGAIIEMLKIEKDPQKHLLFQRATDFCSLLSREIKGRI